MRLYSKLYSVSSMHLGDRISKQNRILVVYSVSIYRRDEEGMQEPRVRRVTKR